MPVKCKSKISFNFSCKNQFHSKKYKILIHSFLKMSPLLMEICTLKELKNLSKIY